jgi:hypothetical protein
LGAPLALSTDSAWNANENIKLLGAELVLYIEMENLRCLDFDRGDSHVLLAAFPHLASLCVAEISDAHIAGVVRRLLRLGLANSTPEDSCKPDAGRPFARTTV